ncbi:PREDICTED: anoctamin-1 isoform X2 [Nicrophorus vespilloides]|uniref:Anoctamin n=1 Tax=Nicrophorus vespilloides TaxID=110193 RepID=A0ABM1MVK0_NICVS|nr:PREDICTED: anoctamin-1 isoform X2 [Nicrophorus vespilloides]
MEDDDDEFYDTISVNSQLVGDNRRRRSYLSLSRNTVYYSAFDLNMELEPLQENSNSDLQLPRPKTWRNAKDNVSVDFVLAYENDCDKRRLFEQNLADVGFILQTEEVQKIKFILIHVPQHVLYQYAEILKLRMPLKINFEQRDNNNFLATSINKFLHWSRIKLDKTLFPPKNYTLTAEFSRDKIYLFDENSPDYFNLQTRITVISYILEREKFGDKEQEKGIKKLLAENIYKAAYPLHDGDLKNVNCIRRRLLDEWASVSKGIKYQPIDDIKDYFGVKIALYFTWLGFYTHMLIPASIFGLLCFLFGILTMNRDQLSIDICTQNITMCPLCDKICPFWQLKDACLFSKITYLVDNPVTVVFAVMMSVWSALYLEMWKRYSAEITHRWGLTGFDLLAEPPRPEFLTRLANAKKEKINVVTLLKEPVVPYWRVKVPSILFSFTVVILSMTAAIAVVFAIVMYRMSLLTSSALYGDKSSYRIYVVPVTGGVINLICIFILNYFYNMLAEYLTETELHRTQTEHEDSLTLKIYLFQFVNYYTCLFYIAFLKGKFVGYPAKYNRIFGARQEECQPGGCLMELTIQLTIIMIGKQAFHSVFEIIKPLAIKMYNKFKFKIKPEEVCTQNQWTEDYKLLELEPNGLFQEYLEMVLQYGFVTIFVTAFPLAPLFALINNIFEMRLDGKKMLKYFRKPVPKRVKDIGVWYPIMNTIGRISVVTNAFIIAFSSQFIPKLVYSMKWNHDRTENGFLHFTLTEFNTSDFQVAAAPLKNPNNVQICSFAEYRNDYDHEYKYKRPIEYWHITAARLAFIVVYQNLVGFIITAIQWAIPDIPNKLRDRIKREAYQINESIIREEKRRHLTTQASRAKMNFVDEINREDQNGSLHQRLNRVNSISNNTSDQVSGSASSPSANSNSSSEGSTDQSESNS